jgi:hypothetical protein
MKKLKLVFIGTMLGILVSIFVDKATHKPIVKKYHVTLTQDWSKTCNDKEKAYYEHLLRTKP